MLDDPGLSAFFVFYNRYNIIFTKESVLFIQFTGDFCRWNDAYGRNTHEIFAYFKTPLKEYFVSHKFSKDSIYLLR